MILNAKQSIRALPLIIISCNLLSGGMFHLLHIEISSQVPTPPGLKELRWSGKLKK